MALAFAVVLVALAGCIDQGLPLPLAPPDAATTAPARYTVHVPGGPVLTPAQTPSSLVPLAPAWFPLDHDAIEPTLGITSDGTLFYTAASFVPNIHADVLRSSDGGATWEDVSPRLPTGDNIPPRSFDPYLYVDPVTDRVFDYSMYPPLVCATVSISDDLGASWISQPVGCGTPPPYDHQTLAAGPPRGVPLVVYPNVVYSCVNRLTDSTCSRSFDGGLTWTAGTPVFWGLAPLGDNCGGLHGHVNVGPDGTVYLPRDYCGKPYVGISRDDGASWERVLVADIETSGGPDPAMGMDAAGNAYYAFVDAKGFLLLSASTDQGATWSEPVVLSVPAVTAAHLPAVAAGDEGKVVIAYVGTENLPDGYENKDFDNGVNHTEDTDIAASTWNGYLAVLTNALDPQGAVQTAMVNDPADPLVRGYCGPGRCPGMYDFIDVVVGKDGKPYAAFVDACVEKCATPEGTWEDSQGSKMAFAGAMATLASGPSLVGAGEPAQPPPSAPLAPRLAGMAGR